MSKKDAGRLVKDLKRHFKATGSDLSLEVRGGHWHVVTPQGKSLLAFATTPGEHRFRANTVSELRRRGIVSKEFR